MLYELKTCSIEREAHINQATELAGLNAKRDSILQEISKVDDFRQGSLPPQYRRCGKPYCLCAKAGSKDTGGGCGRSPGLWREKLFQTQYQMKRAEACTGPLRRAMPSWPCVFQSQRPLRSVYGPTQGGLRGRVKRNFRAPVYTPGIATEPNCRKKVTACYMKSINPSSSPTINPKLAVWLCMLFDWGISSSCTM